MKQLNAFWMSLALVLGFAAAAVPAHAEDTDPAQPQAPEVSDETLEQFTTAMADVRSIGQVYSDRIANAEDTEAAQALQRDAQEKMMSAVEDAGLSVQQYNAIAQRMNQDEELMERVQEML
ncbi:DUF4168 domain-containing protein [Saccharospirillum salsuginis]|uniref:DUF4168 domain-containing protein n=1 Tax=Saccharospirillum salsuginis TaxID=418750 RepID=A0A918NIU2_9GAMM|nr:DUF4168 domain-containing protein [Saccharospirillum salsuginis]GGX70733.1 hypothetical protein GCM10007392_42770 [Saccharospirillum salsuginis]